MQAFAPVLASHGGGAVVNVLSVLSWLTLPGSGGYSASKAAGWALDNALRQELKTQRTELRGMDCGRCGRVRVSHGRSTRGDLDWAGVR